jgi:hypothetical protein
MNRTLLFEPDCFEQNTLEKIGSHAAEGPNSGEVCIKLKTSLNWVRDSV